MFKEIFKDRKALVGIVISLVLLLVSLLSLAFNIQSSELPYIVHYKASSGIDLFGSWGDVYYLIFAGALVFIVNLILVRLVWARSKELSYFLIFSTPILQIFILISVISLVYINK